MPRPETELPKTDHVYSREDAQRDLNIIRTQTYAYISEMEDVNRRAVERDGFQTDEERKASERFWNIVRRAEEFRKKLPRGKRQEQTP